LEAALAKRLVTIPVETIEQMETRGRRHGILHEVYGTFYNWYCGQYPNRDAYKYPKLLAGTLISAIRLQKHRGDVGLNQPIREEIGHLLEAIKTVRPTSRRILPIFCYCMSIFPTMDQAKKQEITDEFLETGIVDEALFGNLDEYMDEYTEKIAKIYESRPPSQNRTDTCTKYIQEILKVKLSERKKQHRNIMKKRLDSYREELVAKTNHPVREYDWCMDEEEKAEHLESLGTTAEEYRRDLLEVYNIPHSF
jgi:hypothetical protein